MLGPHLRENIGRKIYPQAMMKCYAPMPKRNYWWEHLPPGYDEILIPDPHPKEIIGRTSIPRL